MTKKLLISSLTVDGLSQRAFVFTFLPLCFERAKANSVAGLTVMMQVLAELAEMVAWYYDSDEQLTLTTQVDLSDLASFIGSVKSRSVLATCVARSKFKIAADTVVVLMTESNWKLVDTIDGQEQSTSHLLRQILHHQQEILHQSRPKVDSWAARSESMSDCNNEELEVPSVSSSMSYMSPHALCEI